MKLSLQTILRSNRRFYAAVAVVLLLMAAAFTYLQVSSHLRFVDFIHSSWEFQSREYCARSSWEMLDFAWETFAPHVKAVTEVPVLGASSDTMQKTLAQLAALPGVRRAYCLQEGVQLSANAGAAPEEMRSVLAGLRRKFATYFNGGKRFSEKFDTFVWSRARFANVPVAGDTLRLILGAFDLNGLPIHMLPSLDTDPSGVRYLIALDMDPSWIRQAVARQCAEALHARWSLILFSPPPYDSTKQWIHGFKVVALGDTVWRVGVQSVPSPGYESLTDTSGCEWPPICIRDADWITVGALYLDEAADVKNRTDFLRRYYVQMGIVDLAAIIALALLLWGLLFIRRQWLARQTALTHLAHAIRTPAARLKLDVDTLLEKRSISPAEEKEVMQSIGNECSRIERAVQNAALSLNGNGHTIDRTAGDLSLIIGEALRPWKSNFQSAGIQLETPPSLPPLRGKYDAEMMVTLLDNLLDNALRHTRIQQQRTAGRAQTVAVGLRAMDGSAVLTVDDSGTGIPAADRQRIFKRFERGSDPALTGTSGLGLGLALVKEIAEAHGGSVAVEDSRLGGARFTVQLPLDGTMVQHGSKRGAHSDH